MSSKHMRSQQEVHRPFEAGRIRAVDLVLPVLCLLVYGAWAWTLPVYMAPDEAMRLPVPFFILEHGYLPQGDEAEIVHGIWGTSYAFVPYGSSLVGLLFMRITACFTLDQVALIRAVRLASVLSAAGTVFLCERIGKRLFSHPASPYLLAVTCGLLPQFAFLAAYLNNDAFMMLTTAAIIDAWLVGVSRSWDVPSKVFLGVSLGLCALSYYFAYGYIIASVVIFFATSRPIRRVLERPLSWVIRGAALVFVVAMCVGGWFFVRNFVIHDGDIFGMRASSELAEELALDDYKPSAHATPQRLGVSPTEMMFEEYLGTIWVESTIQSGIGMFGFMSVPLGKTTYRSYYAFFVVGMLASVIFVLRAKAEHRRLITATLLLLIAFGCLMAIYYSWASDFQPQGRYLASAFVPYCILIVGGYDCLSSPGEPAQGRHLGAQGTAAYALVPAFGLLAGDGPMPSRVRAVRRCIPWVAMALYGFLFVYVALSVVIPNCIGNVL